MERLPIEMLLKIFSYLDFDSVLQMRLQSKRFNEIVRLMTFHELTFYEARLIFPFGSDELTVETAMKRMFKLKNNWFFIKRPIVFHNPVALDRMHLLFKNVINLNALKRLRICSDPIYPDPPIKLSTHHLNQLKQLEHLDLDLSCVQPNHERHHLLCLPNLVGLQIRQDRAYGQINLVMKGSLKLKGLSLIGHIGSCHIEPSGSITHLRSPIYHERIVGAFKNLTYLELDFPPPNNLLSLLPRLKELRANSCMAYLERQKHELGRTQLRIFEYGVELTKDLSNDQQLERVRQYGYLRQFVPNAWISFKEIAPDPLDQLYLKHYDRLATSLEAVDTIKFDSLLTAFRSLIPVDLFAKFNNIKSLLVGSRSDAEPLAVLLPTRFHPQQLAQLIANCKNLCSLSVFMPSDRCLSQNFFDCLPERSSLFVLIVHQLPAFRLNFKFLNRMQQLRRLETNQAICADQLEFDSLKNLGHFEFSHKQKSFKIKRSAANQPFSLYAGTQELFKAAKFSETIRWFSIKCGAFPEDKQIDRVAFA